MPPDPESPKASPEGSPKTSPETLPAKTPGRGAEAVARDAERKVRLAAALRDNLKRRKAGGKTGSESGG